MEILLLRQSGSREAETRKEPEPKVTVSKAQGQCPRQELEEQLTQSKNVQSQHSETVFMTQSFLTLDGATPLESTHHIWALKVQLILELLVLHYEETEEERQTLHILDDSGVSITEAGPGLGWTSEVPGVPT